MSDIEIYRKRLGGSPVAYTSSMDRTFVDRKASTTKRQRARDVAQAVLDGQTTILE